MQRVRGLELEMSVVGMLYMKVGLKSGIVPCRDMARLLIMLKGLKALVFTGLLWDGCSVAKHHRPHSETEEPLSQRDGLLLEMQIQTPSEVGLSL